MNAPAIRAVCTCLLALPLFACARPGAGDDVANLYTTPDQYAALEAEYAATKALVRSVTGEEVPPENAGVPEIVFDCGYTEGIDSSVAEEPEPSSTQILIVAAKAAVALERTFRDSGYPDWVWKPQLQDYERQALMNVLRARQAEGSDDPYADDVAQFQIYYPVHIVADAKTYRNKVDPKLKAIEAMDGCGAGESPTVIRAEGAKSVALLSEFQAKMCQAVAPAQPLDACRYWYSVPLDSPFEASGIQRYRVVWDDRKVSTGTVDFETLMESAGQDDDGNTVLVIAR